MSAKVPNATRLAFGLGQASEGIKNGAFEVFVFFFYTSVLGLDPGWAGVAVFIALVFDAVTDPVVGAISDRLSTRWGRRHPFLYASALPLGCSFFALLAPPSGLGQIGLFCWLLTWSIAVRGAMSLHHVPYLSLGSELTTDYGERTAVSAIRTLFSMVGGAAFVFVAWTILGAADATSLQHVDRAVYESVGVVGGVAMCAVILVSALGTHDRIPHLPQATGVREGIVDSVRCALQSAPFRILFVAALSFFVMRGVQVTLGTHLLTFYWQVSVDAIRKLHLAIAVGVLAGASLASPLSRRLDKRAVLSLGIGAYGGAVVLPPLGSLVGAFPPATSALFMPLHILATGIAGGGAGAAVVIAGSMMADIADAHEYGSGRRQEGVFFGALALGGKASSGLGHLIAGQGLRQIEFPLLAQPGQVDSGPLQLLALLYLVPVAILGAAALLCARRYPLDRAEFDRIQTVLRTRGARGEPL